MTSTYFTSLIKTILFLCIYSQWTISYAQFDASLFKSLSFRNIGPAGMSGRITAIDVDPFNTDKIFVGSASGGVWLSKNGGISWKPIFDSEECLAIGSIKINPSNTSEIWVGTGEGNPRNSLNTGRGIYKSIDGGLTWQNVGLKNTKTIHRIIIDPNQSGVVYAACPGTPWGKSEDRGVYKTTNGGKSWKKILYVNDLTGAADMVMDPKNPNKIIVAMWEHMREPWFFKSGGTGSGIYITYDGGENWSAVKSEDGIPKGTLGRIGLAIAPSNPDKVYALIEAEKNGLYVSENGGKKWTLVSTKNIGNRPFYYAELYVDPLNEYRLYNVFTYLTRSIDGGKTFENIADYGNNVHPDHHAFWIHPSDPSFIIDGNDGGLNISRDGGDTWQFVGNIPVGQFYHVNIDHDFPYNVYGGMQDNGSWVGPSAVLRSGGIHNYDFSELYFGDGFDVVPHPTDNRYGYAMSQGGNVARYDRTLGKTEFIKPIHPNPNITLRFNWNAGIAQDPFNDCGLYFGSQFLHHSQDCGRSWTIISPDLTTNDTLKQVADKSGGLTLDATMAENHTTILCIAPSKIDENVIWVGTDDGQLQLTMDKGITWNNLSNRLKGLPEGSWIPQIHVSDSNSGEAFVVANNYRRNDDKPYVYHTSDYGKNWSLLTTDKDIPYFALSIVQDVIAPNLLFLGTDGGLYVSFDKGKKWHHLRDKFPAVQVSDMKIHPTHHDLVLGTFGRAFWILDDIRPLRTIAKNPDILKDTKLVIFESAPGYLTSNASYKGIRFYGQGEFIGENKRFDQIAINTYIAPELFRKSNTENDKKEKTSEKKKKATIKIYDHTHNHVRTFSNEVDSGLNRIVWGLEKDGQPYPNRNKNNTENKDSKDAPRGFKVGPGQYVVHIEYAGYRDSSIIKVLDDPRSNIRSIEQNTQKVLAEDRLSSLIKETKEYHDTLKYMQGRIKIVETLVMTQGDTALRQEFKKLHKTLEDKLMHFDNQFLAPEEQKGIQRNPELMVAYLYNATQYISSAWEAPHENAQLALNKASLKWEKLKNDIDTFIGKDWLEYKDKLQNTTWHLFGDIK